MEITDLPTVNACLNGCAAILLCMGYRFIRLKQVAAHRRCMLSAAGCSVLFLICYLTYHWLVGSVKYAGEGWDRTVYLGILLTHTVLATVNVPMVVITLLHAFRDRREKHRRMARWTLPIWLYVSVTGVVIYLMLYHGPGRGT